MDEIVVPSSTEEQPLFQQMMSQYGGPAFLRRAHRAEAALTALRAKLTKTRAAWLDMVELRLATVQGLAGDWGRLRPWLSPTEIQLLARLHAELQPVLRAPVSPTRREAAIRSALVELSESLRRFNDRWRKLIAETDLGEVNQRRDEYNRYYLLEKECAVGSPRIARQGFRPYAPLTTEDLLAWFPLLIQFEPPRDKAS